MLKDKYVYNNLTNIECVYLIRNTFNNKVYIGSTKTLRRRIYVHFLDLGRQLHRNSYLQEDYNKGHLFTIEIITTAKIEEYVYIHKYEATNRDKGYNVIVNGMDSLRKGKSCSNKMKEKCSKRISPTKGTKMSDATKLKLHYINLGNTHRKDSLNNNKK